MYLARVVENTFFFRHLGTFFPGPFIRTFNATGFLFFARISSCSLVLERFGGSPSFKTVQSQLRHPISIGVTADLHIVLLEFQVLRLPFVKKHD